MGVPNYYFHHRRTCPCPECVSFRHASKSKCECHMCILGREKDKKVIEGWNKNKANNEH